MKFLSVRDAQLFLVELEELSNLETVDETFQPTHEQIQSFIKRRKSILPGLKDFRRSQMAKQQWRSGRYNFMQGIKRFHSSTKGKKFHRQLGRFLSNRDFYTQDRMGSFIRSASEGIEFQDVTETLKALSSCKTHLLIPYDYYMPLSDYVDYILFTEEFIGVINRLEENLLKFNFQLSEDDLEFFLRALDTKCVIYELAERYQLPCASLDENFGEINPLGPDSFIQKFRSITP